jgi:cystathionine beta-lyase/cystathionine gamma-synthase
MDTTIPSASRRWAQQESAKAPQTIAASNGIAADKAFSASTPPIYLSSTFAFAGLEQSGAYEYTARRQSKSRSACRYNRQAGGGSRGVVVSSGPRSNGDGVGDGPQRR